MTEWLRRKASPLSEKVWKVIDDTAIAMMKQTLVARRIVDFEGPRGWAHVATQLGTFKPVASRGASRVRLSVPDVILLTEIRADFSLPWSSIDTFERMGPMLETAPIEEVALEMALAEDRFVFFGTGAFQPGLLTSPEIPRVGLSDWSKPGRVVTDLLSAVQKLDEVGIKGPYEAVLSPTHYYAYLKSTVDGYPAAKQIGMVIDKVHSSPVIEDAVLFSVRGGDFVITVGGDFSVGYRWHDENAVHLFCIETIAAQLLTPRAVCLIKPD